MNGTITDSNWKIRFKSRKNRIADNSNMYFKRKKSVCRAARHLDEWLNIIIDRKENVWDGWVEF